VRPSVDLPINGRSQSAAPNSATTAAQRRNRDALRNYYNLSSNGKAAPKGSRTDSITSTTSNSTLVSTTQPDSSSLLAALSSPSFAPEAFTSTLLASSPLKTILQTESALISEIRNLDGERKALVYDNYSKLIRAVETIGEMRRSMEEGTVGDVKEVEGRVGGIVGVVATLGGRGDVDVRRKGEKEEKDRREVVRWVVEAPQRWSGVIGDGREAEAIEEWRVVKKILGKWEGMRGVDEVRKSCEEVMSTATTQQNGD
jgi:vacuolar protein sorting-associated protein 51